MPTGRSRYQAYRHLVNVQEQQVNHVQEHFEQFTADAGAKNNGSKRGRAGNYPIVQFIHNIAGAGGYLNTSSEIQNFGLEKSYLQDLT